MGIATWTRTGAKFITTRWSLIQRAGDRAAPDSSPALDEVARVYWPPVYGYLRAKGRSRDEAAELTQGFFADVIVRRNLAGSARDGRFRALLLAALRNYAIDQARHRKARGGGVSHGPVNPDIADAMLGTSAPASPDAAFEAAWAAAQVKEALARCETYWRERGKATHWEAFEVRIIRPACSGVTAVPLAELAPRLGFASAAAAAAAVQTVKKKMQAILSELEAGPL